MMQKVLKETFSSRADVEVVGVASGCLSAVGMIPELQPELVVIDSNLPEIEANQLIIRSKQELQSICCLRLVETTQQLIQVAKVGADFALHAYALSDNLDRVLENLRIGKKSDQEQ
jgi:DNA-binding NarL/FixJ family response regulator